jgi:hypothetical protein
MPSKLFEEAFLLRLPRGTLEQLRERAAQHGQTVSEYLRQLVRRSIKTR